LSFEVWKMLVEAREAPDPSHRPIINLLRQRRVLGVLFDY